MHHYGLALVVHPDAAISPRGSNCFPGELRRTLRSTRCQHSASRCSRRLRGFDLRRIHSCDPVGDDPFRLDHTAVPNLNLID
jgi:hypothetical protein